MILNKFQFTPVENTREFKSLIPKTCGVYYISVCNGDVERIFYIGSSSNLHVRLRCHPKAKALKTFILNNESIKMGYYEIADVSGFFEKWLLATYKPIMNEKNYPHFSSIKCLHTLINVNNRVSYAKFIFELYRHYCHYKRTNNISDVAIALKLNRKGNYYFNDLFNPKHQTVTTQFLIRFMKFIGVEGSIKNNNKVKSYKIKKLPYTQNN